MKLLTIISLVLAPSIHAFSVTRKTTTRTTLFSTQEAKPRDFERAVECSGTFGLCDVDELLSLADDLEKHQGCFFEDTKEAWLCDKEESDRTDVAEVLRMQSELQLRMDYLKQANLFKADVDENRNVHERDELMEEMEVFGTD